LKELVDSCWLIVVGCGKFVNRLSFIVERCFAYIKQNESTRLSFYRPQISNHKSQITNYAIFSILTSYFSLLTSCSLIQPPEDIPSYIRVQSYTFKDSLNQGTNSSRVTDIEVTAGSDYRGFYQIPVSVPILAKGNQTITIEACVFEDGLSSSILPYPFYTPFVTTVNLVPGKLDTIKPVFKYKPNIQFLWGQGDFEGPDNALKSFGNNTSLIGKTSDKASVFEGSYSFEADLSNGRDTFEAISNFKPFVDPAEPPLPVVWLEMNYKTDVAMDIGIIPLTHVSSPGEQFISGVNPTTTWKKVYVNISPTLKYWYGQNQPNTTEYYIYFYAVNTNGGTAHIFIDNLKLLSF